MYPGYRVRARKGENKVESNSIIQVCNTIYIIKRDIHIYIYVAYAGQTAGPIWRKLCLDTEGWPGGFYAKKIRTFFPNLFSHRQRRALQLVLPILGSQGASRPFCNNFNSEIWFKGFNIY